MNNRVKLLVIIGLCLLFVRTDARTIMRCDTTPISNNYNEIWERNKAVKSRFDNYKARIDQKLKKFQKAHTEQEAELNRQREQLRIYKTDIELYKEVIETQEILVAQSEQTSIKYHEMYLTQLEHTRHLQDIIDKLNSIITRMSHRLDIYDKLDMVEQKIIVNDFKVTPIKSNGNKTRDFENWNSTKVSFQLQNVGNHLLGREFNLVVKIRNLKEDTSVNYGEGNGRDRAYAERVNGCYQAIFSNYHSKEAHTGSEKFVAYIIAVFNDSDDKDNKIERVLATKIFRLK